MHFETKVAHYLSVSKDIGALHHKKTRKRREEEVEGGGGRRSYNVVHVAMGDEEKILGDGAVGTSTNVKGHFECGKYHTCFLSSN